MNLWFVLLCLWLAPALLLLPLFLFLGRRSKRRSGETEAARELAEVHSAALPQEQGFDVDAGNERILEESQFKRKAR